jgi:integrase
LTKLGLAAFWETPPSLRGPLPHLEKQQTFNLLVGGSNPPRLTNPNYQSPDPSRQPTDLLTHFIESRRQGTSQRTIQFYRTFLTPFLSKYPLTSEGVRSFLSGLKCGNTKHTYYRAIHALCNWAVKEGYLVDNPIKNVEVPKIKKIVLPSLTNEQVDYLIEQADTLRNKVIISLFADSGMRLSELTSIKVSQIDWENCLITIWGKGGKQRKAPFTERTARLLGEYVCKNGSEDNIWHLSTWGIISVLRRLEEKTGLPCNPHTFRRTFASNLHRAGLDVEHIMRLGGWESLDMVLRYTKSVKFEESLRLYRGLERI